MSHGGRKRKSTEQTMPTGMPVGIQKLEKIDEQDGEHFVTETSTTNQQSVFQSKQQKYPEQSHSPISEDPENELCKANIDREPAQKKQSQAEDAIGGERTGN